MKKLSFVLAVAVAAFGAHGAFMDRPGGIRLGQRAVLRPYVSLSYTYDSNHDSSSSDTKGSHSFNISPGASLTYKGDQFDLSATAYYQYSAYTRYSDTQNNHTYGESVSFSWHDGATIESDAWSFMVNESYSRMNENDDMLADGGRGIYRDRDQFNINGSLMRNFTEKFHASIYGGYYWLFYNNDNQSYAPLYGWDRWTIGAEIGYRLTRWTDFIITGNYQGYHQDNARPTVWDTDAVRSSYDNNSESFTLHGGVGSAFTERISYRVTAGWTCHKYADTGTHNGFTYTASGRWKITDTWNMMLLASSYYQPSERDYGASTRNDTISWGLAHSMIRGRLTAVLDIAYRHETHDYVDSSGSDYSTDVLTGRVGLDYTLCRFLAVYGRAEYQTEFNDGGDSDNGDWDFDRWRLTVGLRLQY